MYLLTKEKVYTRRFGQPEKSRKDTTPLVSWRVVRASTSTFPTPHHSSACSNFLSDPSPSHRPLSLRELTSSVFLNLIDCFYISPYNFSGNKVLRCQNTQFQTLACNPRPWTVYLTSPMPWFPYHLFTYFLIIYLFLKKLSLTELWHN